MEPPIGRRIAHWCEDPQRRIQWRDRGYLPHTHGRSLTQAVTFSLFDALTPQMVNDRMRDILGDHPEKSLEYDDARLRRIAYDGLLDDGIGSCALRDPRFAEIVEREILYSQKCRYDLHAWVVMPSHVHVLLTPKRDERLGKIIGSWKARSAREIHRITHSRGHFWRREYFDRYIRNLEHFEMTRDYIERNPVKAKLCRSAEEWPFSSAGRRLSRE